MSIPQPLFLKDDSCYGSSHPEPCRLTCYREQQGEIQEGCFFLSLYQQPLRCAKQYKVCAAYTQRSLSLFLSPLVLAFSPIKTFVLRGSGWSTGYGAILLFSSCPDWPFLYFFHFFSEKMALLGIVKAFVVRPCSLSWFWSLHPSC